MAEKELRNAIRGFRDLIVWQKAIEFAKGVYLLSREFPREEQFGLTFQVRKAAVSVSSNIAEGHARQGREFAHFLSIARGSLAEVESQLILGAELGYCAAGRIEPLCALATEIRRMSASLAKKIG